MGLLDVLGLKSPPARAAATPARPARLEPRGEARDALFDEGGDGDGAGPSPTTAAKVAGGAVDAVHEGDGVAPLGAVDAAPGTGAAPADKNLAAYQTARAAIQALVDGLDAHAQKDQIGTEIQAARDKLTEADGLAAAASYKAATAALAEARKLCDAAKKLAGEWAAYAKQRGIVNALILSQKSADTATKTAKREADLAAADLLAKGPPTKFPQALQALKLIEADIKPDLKARLELIQLRLKQAKAAKPKVRAYLAGDIALAEPIVASAEAAYKAGDWALVQTNFRGALKILGQAVRMIGRREKYDAQHAKTVAAIGKVKGGGASLATRVEVLNAIVAQADAKAAPDSMRVEEGLAMLVDAEKRAAGLGLLAPVLAACEKDKAAADAERVALDGHAAAAKVQKERDAIGAQLVAAAAAATAADAAAEPLPAWTAVSTALKRARADLALAKKLADGMGPAAAAEQAGADPASDAKALGTALAALKKDLQAAKAGGTQPAKDEFTRADQRAADADKAIKAGDLATARPALAEAGQALAAAKTIQAEHAQFANTLQDVEAKLKALKKSPRATKIQARIDAAATALADAKAKDAAKDGPGAIAALRLAADAEKAASKADADRKAYDERVALLDKRVAALKDAAEKQKQTAAAAAATTLANGFGFAAAKKALDDLEIALDDARLTAMAGGASPNPAELAKLADKMTKMGGGKQVDAIIHNMPDGNATAAINAMAKGRYGVKFETGTKLPGGDPAKAMKALCDMFAKMPDDIRGNPSINNIRHDDAAGTAVGGGYAYDAGTIGMDGRPNVSNQQFGSKQTSPVGGVQKPQLPAVDPKCEPANEDPVDFLAFAAAHEVGHGVDDQNGFMKREGSKAKYGGWINYGASVGPLVDIVAKHFGLDAKPELKQYCFDKIQSKPATRPAAAAASAEAAALDRFDEWHRVATSANVYRKQSLCEQIKIGDYIYHEAYTRAWVGYLAAARGQGLTGYQFRAPGEWFAELYAGYRSEKLKPDHPAREWLSQLASP